MMNFLFLFLVSFSALATSREEAIDLLTKFETKKNVITRIDVFSANFKGYPYDPKGPLGEGETGRYDQDPLYRFDTFDCTTFVETILSLALTSNVDDFEAKIDEIRYENGEVDYLKRNHYTDLQWVPFNVRNGILSEINHLVLPAAQRLTAEAVIDLPNWLKKIKMSELVVPYATETERQYLLEEIRSLSANYQPVVARINYLPINTLVANPNVLKRIPNGSIVNFIRPNWDLTEVAGTHQNVSHQGFVFQKENGTYLRHASSGDGKVVEILFVNYLKKFVNHPTLKGIHLMQVN